MRRAIGVFVLIAAGFGAAAVLQGGLSSQASQPAQGPDVLPALLVRCGPARRDGGDGLFRAACPARAWTPAAPGATGRQPAPPARDCPGEPLCRSARGGAIPGADRVSRGDVSLLRPRRHVARAGRRAARHDQKCGVVCRDGGAAAAGGGVRHRAGTRHRAGAMDRHQSTDGGARTRAHEKVDSPRGSAAAGVRS